MAILNVITEEIGGDNEEGGGNIRIAINTKEAAKKLAKKLNEEIAKGHEDLAFAIAIGLTLAKDIIGLIPIYGDAIALVVSGGIFLFMFGKGWFLNQRLRVIFWVLNGIIEFIPVIDIVLIPSNIAVMFYAWYLVKKRMRKAESKLSVLNQLTLEEINQLNEDISRLDLEDEQEGIYTSKGTLSRRSQILIREAKSTIRDKGEAIRAPRNARLDDGVKRAISPQKAENNPFQLDRQNIQRRIKAVGEAVDINGQNMMKGESEEEPV